MEDIDSNHLLVPPSNFPKTSTKLVTVNRSFRALAAACGVTIKTFAPLQFVQECALFIN